MRIEEVVESQNPWWRDGGPEPVVHAFRRDLQRLLLGLIQDERERRAHLILGARQVGKTEILRQLIVDSIQAGWPRANITYFRFDDERVVHPVEVTEVAKLQPLGMSSDRPRLLLLDEIRKVPRWDLWLKRTVDDRAGLRIVVTDSAAGILRQKSVESGPGRWDEHSLDGLTLVEFLRIRDGLEPGKEELPTPARLLAKFPQALEDYLLKGGFPEHVSADPRLVPERLRSDIVDRAIRKDLAELDIEIEEARRLFVLLVQDSGSIYVKEHRASDLGRDVRTVDAYAALFEDARLLAPLEQRPRKRSGKLAKPSQRLRVRKKLYAMDHGLVTAFAMLPEPWSDANTRARVFEAVVFRHLRAARESFGFEGPWFVRDDAGEIDFWIETAAGPVAIEVTSSSRPSAKLASFVDFATTSGAKACLLIHGGVTDESRKGFRAVPLPAFLLEPAETLRSLLA